MKYTHALLLLFLYFFFSVQSVIVKTPLGVVEGIEDDFGFSFLGIKYATAKRFLSPTSISPWEGVLPALQFGPPCPQPLALLYNISMSEDCLYMNIYTPKFNNESNPTSYFPVKFWIYGGAYIDGFGCLYDGRQIAFLTNSVVVTMNYRVNIFGFSSFPEDPVANLGLQDQQRALEFVNKNIASFHGDPNDVTVFGESAGGGSILLHLVMPSSAGLFQRAILESLGPGNFLNCSFMFEAQYRAVYEKLGCHSNYFTCLYEKPMDEMVAALGETVFFPCVDGDLIPEEPYLRFEKGEFNRVPIMLGHNKEEGNMYTLLEFHTENPDSVTKAEYEAGLDHWIGYWTNTANVEALYPPEKLNGYWYSFSKMWGDYAIVCPTRLMADVISKQEDTTVFFYEFTHTPSSWIYKDLNCTHTAELPFIFHNNMMDSSFTVEEEQLSLKMVEYWHSFSVTGDPNTLSSLPHFPKYEQTNKTVLILDFTIKPSTDDKMWSKCQDWKKIFWG